MKKVTVFQEHTHEGVTFPAGSEIELPDDAADYLLNAEGDRRAREIKAIQKRKEIMEVPSE